MNRVGRGWRPWRLSHWPDKLMFVADTMSAPTVHPKIPPIDKCPYPPLWRLPIKLIRPPLVSWLNEISRINLCLDRVYDTVLEEPTFHNAKKTIPKEDDLTTTNQNGSKTTFRVVDRDKMPAKLDFQASGSRKTLVTRRVATNSTSWHARHTKQKSIIDRRHMNLYVD